jgi:signal recognition particle subunit SRP54
MVTSSDVYRPAAIQQLQKLAAEVGVAFFPSAADQEPVAIVTQALEQARHQFVDVLIVDTAGRLHVDAAMMAEIQQLHAAVKPVETLFVVDSMTGQDAVNTAQAFNQALPLTGVLLTKADGDARGGAALSIRQVTGKPIKFLGVGEKTAALEPFYPDRLASRILGMGDVLSLVEEAQQKVDQDKVAKLAGKISKGKRFDLGDFRDQLEQMQNMGGLTSLMDKLPGMGQVPKEAMAMADDGQIRRMVAIINSMTAQERLFPDVIKGSRRRRIAAGSGTQVQDVNRLLKQYMQMRKMMKKMSKGGMSKMLRGMKGRMPPGGMPFQG